MTTKPRCALLCTEKGVYVSYARSRRDIPAQRFFRGIYTTDLAPGEIVTAVVVPSIQPGWRSRFDELARRHGDYALVGLTAHCRVDGGAMKEARLAFCGVGATASRAEAVLAGRGPNSDVLAEAGRALDGDFDPPDDVHASPALRRHPARVLLARTVAALIGEAER